MLRKSITLFVLTVTTLFATACPSGSTIATIKASSSKIATYANSGVNLTRDLYRAKYLTDGQKNTIASAFSRLADAGIAFDAAVANAEKIYKTDGIPKTEIEKIFAVFDSEIVSRVITILESLKIVPALNNYRAIVEGLKTAVLTVAAILNQRQGVSVRLAAAS